MLVGEGPREDAMAKNVTPKIVFDVDSAMEHDHYHSCAACGTEAEVYLTVTLHGQKSRPIELDRACKDKVVRAMEAMFG